jgi:hypothetical protein
VKSAVAYGPNPVALVAVVLLQPLSKYERSRDPRVEADVRTGLGAVAHAIALRTLVITFISSEARPNTAFRQRPRVFTDRLFRVSTTYIGVIPPSCGAQASALRLLTLRSDLK